MVQLRSCYFCGATGALSEYETLPNRLREEGHDSQTVVLCDRCHTKLTTVLDPVVEYLSRSPSLSTQTADTTSVAVSADASSDASETVETPGQSEVTFARDAGETGVEPAESTTEGTAVDDSTPDADNERPEEEYSETARVGETEMDEDADEVDEVEGDDGEGEDGGDDGDGRDDEPPRMYYKVMRFLQNREFPIDREEAETVAASAYDLSSRESHDVIQRAIAREVLEEREGELYRR